MRLFDAQEARKGPNQSGAGVALGDHVEVELISEMGEVERLAFDVVPDEEADFSAGFLGVGTPLAQAILGARAGSLLPYAVGDMRQVRVLAVGAGVGAPGGDAVAARQAVIQKAISKSDLADVVRFALTVDQKWGETDPEGIVSNWEEGPS